MTKEEKDAQLEQLKKAAQAQRTKSVEKKNSSNQLSLFDIAPWPDSMRALPNDYARSALFTVKNKRQPREALQKKEIYHINKDIRITYTGLELRADDDALVWQQVLEYAKRKPIGAPITFSFYELCQDLGWSYNGRYIEKAEECLTRLQATAMQFISDRIGQLDSVSLIGRFKVLDRGKRSSQCEVIIDKEMILLFADGHYSKFVWEKYRKLSPTARRLFDYFSSHRDPYPMKLETFRLMCGSETSTPRKWKQQVSKACDELNESGLVYNAFVNGSLVGCQRSNPEPIKAPDGKDGEGDGE
ncbi:plasmid replication initiator TrfA [Klebsiella pneumoniae]|uniref:plasmid replication initiator TrfA n=1 Tax=Klebsiella pneumoniae TaxID=573 RepID=UPI00388EC70D